MPRYPRKRTRSLNCCLLAMLISAGLCGAQAIPPKQVAAGVWFLEGNASAGDCNSVLIEMGSYLILVDPSYPSRTRELMKLIPQLSSKPVRYVVDTHAHRDHAYGNALWTKAGATTVASEWVSREMQRYEPQRWQATAALRKDVQELGLTTAEPPRQTFKGRKLRLLDGSREVDLLYLGWAHTHGDTWVWLPHDRILCTGDAAVNGPRNKLWDADIANWPRVIDRAAALKPSIVLPGHGAFGGLEILTGQANFLRDLYASVKAGIKSGQSMDQMTAAWKFPAPDAPWMPANLTQDVEITASEIRTGKPAGSLPHTWQ